MNIQKVQITIDNRTYKGDWEIKGDRMIVTYQGFQQIQQLGTQPPIELARQLLNELVLKYVTVRTTARKASL